MKRPVFSCDEQDDSWVVTISKPLCRSAGRTLVKLVKWVAGLGAGGGTLALLLHFLVGR